MSSAEWQRIEELFHGALELDAGARQTFLTRECGGDETLREQVESLIAETENGEHFLNAPQLSLGLKVIAENSTGSLVGQTISHYKLTKLLGKGGMGEVYLADDCDLERQVALKFLAPGLVDDVWAKEQLMREARAVARLEHPNICAVYGIEQTADYSFIVMQYVEGETLSTLLQAGRMDLYQALSLAEQIVNALAAAHARGVIHRDIKPQNIVVSADGAKVLDFGLAKFVRRPVAGETAVTVPTQTAQLGAVVGTVAYMSPEQTDAEPLDFRTDLFSFGIVLLQMLTGENPFLRETAEETLEAIRAYRPPSPDKLPREVREELGRIVGRCLEKDRTARFETTEKLLLALRAQRKLVERPDAAELLVRARRRRRMLQRSAVAAVILTAVLLIVANYVHAKLTRVHSIAMLPIVNKSSDPKVIYMSEGLTRNLLDKLSYLPRLRVRAPTVLTPHADEQPDVLKLGRELKVEAVLSGEIVKDAAPARLHVQMLNTADGSRMWEQDFNLEAADLFALQNDVTSHVTSSLGLWLVGSERRLLTKRQTDNQEALNAYMQGRYYWGLKRDANNIQTALKYFDRAISLDPSFAKAYAGRSDCYVLMTNVAYGPLPTKEALDKARFDARQAIEIDDSLAEAHTSMANIKKQYDWDWYQAEVEFRRAIALDPEYPPAHYGYSSLLAIFGRNDEAIKESEIARQVDPYSRLAQMNYGRALYFAGRYTEATAHFRRLLKDSPDYPQYLHMMGLVLLQTGQPDEAIATLETLHAANKLYAAGALGYAYAKQGRRNDAQRILDELSQLNKDKPVPPHEWALIFIGLGDKDRAFELLEESYKERFPNLTSLSIDPIYSDLWAEPRFKDLVRRVGLPR